MTATDFCMTFYEHSSICHLFRSNTLSSRISTEMFNVGSIVIQVNKQNRMSLSATVFFFAKKLLVKLLKPKPVRDGQDAA